MRPLQKRVPKEQFIEMVHEGWEARRRATIGRLGRAELPRDLPDIGGEDESVERRDRFLDPIEVEEGDDDE